MLVDYNPARWSSSPATASSLRAAWHKRDSIHARTNTTNRGPFKSIRLLFNKLRFFKRKKNHQPPIRTLRVPRREKKPKRREILPAGSLAVNIPFPPAEFIKEIGASVLVERLKGHGKKTFRIKAIETVTAAYQSATKGLLPTIQGPLGKTRRRASISSFCDLPDLGPLSTTDSLLTVRQAVITMHRRDPHSSEEPSAAGERQTAI